jgi:hypothetical protein
MRPHSFRCQFNLHRFDEQDEFGRTFCERCGKRKAKRFETITDPALEGRQLTRAKTRGQR